MTKSEIPKTTLLNIQYGIFFNKILIRPDLLTREISDNFQEYFDGIPINLPIPADIVDFPIAQLKSNDKKWQLNVSRNRADIIFTPDENSTYDDLNVEDGKIQEMIIKIADKVRQKPEEAQISRITNISNFIFEINNPENYLRDLFFKDKSQEYKELSIRFNQVVTEDEILFNNLSHYQILNLKKEDTPEKNVLLVQKDFNTDVSKSTFTNAEIEKFWKIAKNNSHTLTFNQWPYDKNSNIHRDY